MGTYEKKEIEKALNYFDANKEVDYTDIAYECIKQEQTERVITTGREHHTDCLAMSCPSCKMHIGFYCGYPVIQKYCQYCGKKIDFGALAEGDRVI